jgi:predicted hydrocarbon binding protein
MPARAPSDVPRAAELFALDAATGALRAAGGQRVIAFSQPMIHGLHAALAERLGANAGDAIYRVGYEWALQDMLRLHLALKDEFGGKSFDFWQMETKFVLGRWWAPLDAAGWGTVAFDWSALARGLVFVELRHSLVAAALPGAAQPVCHLYAGLFAGALSFFERAERHGVEVQCRAQGHETCRFVIGPGPEIDSAEAWRKQGVAAAEIIRRLS